MRAGARRFVGWPGWLVAGVVCAAPLSGETSLQPLVERLGSPDASARAEAACEIGQRGPAAAAAVEALVALLPDDARVGPVECGMSPWLRRTLEAQPEEWRRFETSPGREAAQALARIGRPALAPLLDALSAPSPQARAHAAFGLGEMQPRDGRDEALGRLMLAVKDADAGVRQACVRALGEVDDRRALPTLIGALRDKATPVRATAAWALGEIDDAAAVEPLMRTLWDADAEVRGQAAWALGEIDDRRAVEGLVGALRDTEPNVRRQAAWALGEIADPSAAVPLAGALKDASPEVRKQAAWALGEMKLWE
jgi:HEAT repeat protein